MRTSDIKSKAVSALISLLAGGAGWMVHETVNAASTKAVITERIAAHGAELERQAAAIKSHDVDINSLKVTMSRQTTISEQLTDVVRRHEEDIRKERARRSR